MYKIALLLLLFSVTSCALKPRYEYKIRLEMDSAYIYNGKGKYIGSCPHGNDGIDSVIQADNL